MKYSIKNLVAVMLFVGFALTINSNAQDKNQQKYEVKIKTSAYSEMCKNRIETELKDKDGVLDAYLDLNDQIVTVTYNQNVVKSDKLKEMITDMGYDCSIIEDKAVENSIGSNSKEKLIKK